jgi:hypothetical protein
VSRAKTDPLKTEIENLALALAKDLALEGVTPSDRLAGLKALTGYYAATRKLNLKNTDDDDTVTDFTAFKAKIEAAG